MVEGWGHKVICSPNHNAKHLYTAGTVAERASDLKWAIQHPEADVIWFIRGGYGTAQLLSRLPKACDKPILGFSDATALLTHGWSQSGKPRWNALYHGPVLNSLASLCDEPSQQHLRTWLRSGITPRLTGDYAFGPTIPVEGPIIGGNLCVLASLCGSGVLTDFEGCILALEDIAEPLYKIDRMLLQLELNGVFNGLKAILMGSYHRCKAPEGAEYSLLDVFKERLSHLNIPVYINSQFGHNEVNWLWKYGDIVKLGGNHS